MADAGELLFRISDQVTDDIEEKVEFGKTFVWDLTESNPTDEACAFCDEPEEKFNVSAFDIAVPLASGRVALKGALGMMRAGYMLGVTREHLTSFAQLSSATLTEIDAAFNDVEERLCADLSQDSYIRLEHGSDNVESCGLGAGACVVHAHQHLIPAAGATAERMWEQDIAWHELGGYSDLSSLKGSPYLYVGFNGKHYAAIDPKVRSQWGRRIIAQEDGHDEWDWAVFSGSLNLIQTFVSQGNLPQGRMIVSHDSYADFWPRMRLRGEGLYK